MVSDQLPDALDWTLGESISTFIYLQKIEREKELKKYSLAPLAGPGEVDWPKKPEVEHLVRLSL